MNVIYLDNNATTKVDEQVIQAMLPYLTEFYGNPSSMHSFGGQVGKAVREARAQVAALLGAEDSEIIFTSCGTEGNNAAIKAALAAQPEKRHIITTQVEHAAILNVCKQLEKQGYTVTYLSVDRKGQIDLMELEAALTGNTALVSTMYEPDLLWSTAWFLQSMGAEIQTAVTTTKSPLLEQLPVETVIIGDLEDFERITGCSQPLLSQLLTMDLHQMNFAKRRSYRDRNCPVCGNHSHHYPTPLICPTHYSPLPTPSLNYYL